MKLLIKNANLISMDEQRPQIQENMDILINDNIIEQIGRDIKIKADKTIEAENKVLMPGLINTHSHVPMSIFREIVDGYPLQRWLEEKIWPIEAKLIGKDIYNASLISFEEMIKTGTTTINDQYFFAENIIEAAKEKNVRIELTRVLMDIDGDGDKRIKELKDLIEMHNKKDDKITISVGIHGLYTCSPQYIEKCVSIAKEHNLTIHMHFCENEKEVEDIKRMYKVKYPGQVLEKYFGGTNTILAHCVELTKQDMKIIKDMNMSVAHCPVSNLRLACGIAKIEEMRKMGTNITIGTDGQGSGSNLDMFESMKFAALMQKGQFKDACAMPAYEVLKMATINGAKALNKAGEIGSIEVGKKADMILIDLDTPVTSPINDIFADIVYNVKGYNVITTIIDGKIV